MDIYLTTLQLGKYLPLVTFTSGDNCMIHWNLKGCTIKRENGREKERMGKRENVCVCVCVFVCPIICSLSSPNY